MYNPNNEAIMPIDTQAVKEETAKFRQDALRLKNEIGEMIVGMEDIVEWILVSLFAGGHCLLEGVPGLGKTMLVRTLAQALDLNFSRIQFTPDLMPADIIGTNMINTDDAGKRHFVFERGPVFANILLADEVNRATPKTQSAMLEAMQEHNVTVAGKRYVLDPPFFVLATQNPLEMEGTYPLPEAQLDRFFFKLLLDYPSREELGVILDRTTREITPEVNKVMDHQTLLHWMDLAREVVIAPHVQDFAIRCVMATQPESEFATAMVKKFVRYGSSPRGTQSLILAAKVKALLDERFNVGFGDIAKAVYPSLRHRLILNFEAEAEGITADQILTDLLQHIKQQEQIAEKQ